MSNKARIGSFMQWRLPASVSSGTLAAPFEPLLLDGPGFWTCFCVRKRPDQTDKGSVRLCWVSVRADIGVQEVVHEDLAGILPCRGRWDMEVPPLQVIEGGEQPSNVRGPC